MLDQDRLSGLIGSIYDAAADPEGWPAALESVMEAAGATSGGLHLYDPAARTCANIVPRTDPEWTRRFREEWVDRYALWQSAVRRPVGQLFTLECLSPREEIERSSFYNEFLRPQDEDFGLGVNLLAEGSTARGWLFLFRGPRRGQFGSGEAQVLASLAPHLRRALELQRRLSGLEVRQGGAAAALDRLGQAALLVTADARVLLANRAAEAILVEGSGLLLARGRLAACRPADTTRLQRLVADAATAAAGGPVALPRGEERTPLAAFIVPLPRPAGLAWLSSGELPAAVIFVRDPESTSSPTARQLTDLFGLTPAQAALAFEVACGGDGGLPAAARRLRIAHATARAHLAAVFAKTGAHNQVELVRLLLGCGPGLWADRYDGAGSRIAGSTAVAAE
ncbi:MAG TPA: helix-turn-helix transcriptional regulator [Falsiroseomonas sp.]|jgi:DNA-binding CsgD family transcriptional regulator/PAS domain-containing protein|nr:helix-turn-helix transcriptional regulator [Falsiroseomonas sp.]